MKIDATIIRLTIAQCRLFCDWPAVDINRLVDAADFMVVESGIRVADAGAQLEYLYLIATGSMRITRPIKPGQEFGGWPLLPGDAYGLLPLLAQQPSLYAATCREKCILVRIPEESLIESIVKNGQRVFPLVTELYRRYAALLSYHQSFATYSVRARVATVLLSIAARMPSGSSIANVCLSQLEIAGILGTRRQVVNRAIRSLEHDGAIVVKYSRILLIDLCKLEKLSRDENIYL
ncbi:Crp/Fnr family transcriptional regulator [Burkholderia pseudomallei]|uniref:Cyclic nucleotide-binding domain protein n=1 Tax=Burkholderia pseudomallei TaxID=28450 RepID=A0A2K9DGR3_BURPE|nr:Crp/Fnr family transcriptional regulator [Burkholderia pseudomallei]AIP02390.1 cyclic nucleotide-binding domain protein [Burkholderia pseudomallei]AUG25738.1 Crp/Fnr family transcriptional regulator [Burkholderia pseudomallei]KAA8761020.1 Crp/Fnr family transcriptional regulator [Burkholderia pseudomallei]KGC94139.1 cyclic nucleotide-binding domain protein [Burkholderia pseudomallei]KGD49433.1 cyclic nucleotide-binding domain protein [Burkholderia pseudomallei]